MNPIEKALRGVDRWQQRHKLSAFAFGVIKKYDDDNADQSAEINVVLARRLYPRSILQPPLTEPDRAALALQPLQNQRRPEQRIEVTFTDRPEDQSAPTRTPRNPGDISPPANRPRQ